MDVWTRTRVEHERAGPHEVDSICPRFVPLDDALLPSRHFSLCLRLFNSSSTIRLVMFSARRLSSLIRVMAAVHPPCAQVVSCTVAGGDGQPPMSSEPHGEGENCGGRLQAVVLRIYSS